MNMQTRTLHLILATALADAANAEGDCDNTRQAIHTKHSHLVQFHEKNEEYKSALRRFEASCRDQGATLSAKVANFSLALSCTAELDVSGMDAQLRDLGATCQSQFNELKRLEKVLRSILEVVQIDLKGGQLYIQGSEMLQELCPSEARDVDLLVREYHELRKRMILVEDNTEIARVDYLKFTETASALHAATKARGEGCGEMGKEPGRVLANKNNSNNAGAPAMSGPSVNPASSITGVEESKRKEALSRTMVVEKMSAASRMLASVEGPMVAKTGQGSSAGFATRSVAGFAVTSSSSPTSPLAAAARLASATAMAAKGESILANIPSMNRPALPSTDFKESFNGDRSPASVEKNSVGSAIWQLPSNGEAKAELELKVGVVALGEVEELGRKENSSASSEDSLSLFEKVKKRYQSHELFRNTAARTVVGNY